MWLGIAALCALGVICWVPTRILYRVALDPKIKKPPVAKEIIAVQEGYAPFFDNARKEEISIRSEEGLRLQGYIIHKQDTRFVILLHGYTQDARGIAGPASWFWEKGYSVLLPDARGHGRSEGDYFGMGWKERRDVLLWVEELNRRYHTPQIVLYGISMGGATVMMATGEPLPSNVVAAVEDCGYTSVWDEFAYQMKTRVHLPSFPYLYLADRIARRRAGYGFREASAVSQVAKSKTPTLFIHGDADDFVPYEFLRQVYDAAACEKEMLTVPGAPHGLSAPTNPELYWSRVSAFLEKHTGT